MNKGVSTVLYPASDLARTKALFSRLFGVDPVVDEPYYVQFTVADQDIGLDPNGKQRGMTGATPFWDVEEIESLVAALAEGGATIVESPHDVGRGLLVAMVRDADGSMIGLRQAP